MKKMAMMAAAAAVLAVFAAPQLQAEKHKKGMDAHAGHGAHGKEQVKKVTIRGEVIDMSCYMAHEGMGKKHKKCATSCILDKGLPMGLLTEDGKVFPLIEDHAQAKFYKQVKELAAETVEISGKQYTRGGISVVSVGSVKKL